MSVVTLPPDERRRLARRLTWSARSGGRLLGAFTALIAGLTAWLWQAGGSREELVGGVALTLAFALPAWFQQVSRPAAVRRLLADELTCAAGRVVGLDAGGDPPGWSVKVRMRPPDGVEIEGAFWAYDRPEWIPGEPMEFLIARDGRSFFPRRLPVRADPGRVDARRAQPRQLTLRRVAVWLLLLFVCAAGVVMARESGQIP